MASQDSQPFHWHYAELDDKNFQIHGRNLLLIIILFSLLLLFTLLCLYARWVCRYRQFGTAQLQINAVTQTTSGGAGLDAAAIDSLPVLLHRSSTAEEAQCSICLSAFQDEEKVKVLPDCNHAFHPECVDKWLTNHPSCPLCRASLGTTSVETA